MFLLFVLSAAGTNTFGPVDHTRTLRVAELKRSYLVHVPPGYDGSKPMPVVLAFHGGLGNAELMARFCGLSQKADEAGFIVVYPNGTGRMERALTWNGGNCCGYAVQNHVDDVAFTRALLDDLAHQVKVDPKRVYATGMSNGAIMAYRLASELSDRIAAIAPVSGPMGTATCNPKRPVSVIHFHGTADEFAPFAGGSGRKSLAGIKFYSVDYTIQAWVKADGCREEPLTEELPDTQDGTRVKVKKHLSGREGAEVFLVEIEGGGHAWPGKEPRVNFLGKSTKTLSANDAMWEFFKQHPMK